MPGTKHYELEGLEDDYRKLTTSGDRSAAMRMRSLIESIRYDLRMEEEVVMEYRTGMDTPMVMRILRSERDLERWVEQRFVRLSEF